MLSAQVPTFHVDCGTALTAVVRRIAAKNFILVVSGAMPVYEDEIDSFTTTMK
jgi:hypothetical protein